MTRIEFNQFEKSMESCIDKVADDSEPIVITRKGKNVVLISEKAYNNLIENAYLLKDKANYDWLMQSKKQLESHQTIDVHID